MSRICGKRPASLRPHRVVLNAVGCKPTQSPAVGRMRSYCAGCHGVRGEGIQAPALNNQSFLSSASDSYLIETIGRGRRGTQMQSFRSASPVHPALADDDIESLVAFLRTWEVDPTGLEKQP